MDIIKYVIQGIDAEGNVTVEEVNWSFSNNSIIFNIPKSEKEIKAFRIAWQHEEVTHGNYGNNKLRTD